MYKKPIFTESQLTEENGWVPEITEGETIEQKMERVVNNNEPIEDGAPTIYTERKDGVMPEYDIRTDKWEVAQNAMDLVTKNDIARRNERIENRQKALEELKKSKEPKENDGKPEPAQGTSNTAEG